MFKHHLSRLFLAPLFFMLSLNAFADEVSWSRKLYDYIIFVEEEYAYYFHIYDDGTHFPKSRERDILQYIETEFLQPHGDEIIEKNGRAFLYYSHSIDMAKLFMRYGSIAFAPTKSHEVQPITGVAEQLIRQTNINKNLTHDDIIAINESSNKNENEKWVYNLPSNNSIALIKLYLSLGANIYDKESYDANGALYESLYDYDYSFAEEEGVKLDEKHKVTNIQKYISSETEINYYGEGIFYRSPVTYWIEDFIAADQSVTLLETHPLLYSAFIEAADVADVADILNNPKAHKIAINSNCPYIKADKKGNKNKAEVKKICPLTPHINMRDAMGRTPLHIAKVTGNDAVYDYLIAQNADTTIKDFRGNLAASMTKTYFTSYEERIEFMVEEIFENLANIPFSPFIKALFPELKQTIIKIEFRGDILDAEWDRLDLFYDALKKHNKLNILPEYTLNNMEYKRNPLY